MWEQRENKKDLERWWIETSMMILLSLMRILVWDKSEAGQTEQGSQDHSTTAIQESVIQLYKNTKIHSRSKNGKYEKNKSQATNDADGDQQFLT